MLQLPHPCPKQQVRSRTGKRRLLWAKLSPFKEFPPKASTNNFLPYLLSYSYQQEKMENKCTSVTGHIATSSNIYVELLSLKKKGEWILSRKCEVSATFGTSRFKTCESKFPHRHNGAEAFSRRPWGFCEMTQVKWPAARLPHGGR